MSAEVERLRALLADARDELAVLASYVGDPETKWPNAGLMITAKAHKRMVERINTALEESKALPPIDSGEKCPHCKGRMVMRMRRTDAHAFYGCANYPRCTATRDLDGTADCHPDPHGNMDGTGDDIYDLDNGGWGND